jgi:hypothetical protein
LPRKDGAEARKERIAKIATEVQKQLYQNKELGYIPLKKTIVIQSLDTGLTKRKVKEYLEDLAEAGQFEIDEEKDQIRKPSSGV